MPLGLPSHLHVALLPVGGIVLDVRADRYRRLGPLDAAVMERLADGRPLEGELARAAQDAVEAGLLTAGSEARTPRRRAIDVPQSSALEHDGPCETVGVVRVCAALAAARVRLRFTGLQASLMVRSRRHGSRMDRTVFADALARGFARSRIACPLDRACLPDAMALRRFLAARGVHALLVLGVRDHPFAAHAWVQTADDILSDTLDPVRELTPIFAR